MNCRVDWSGGGGGVRRRERGGDFVFNHKEHKDHKEGDGSVCDLMRRGWGLECRQLRVDRHTCCREARICSSRGAFFLASGGARIQKNAPLAKRQPVVSTE
jgi:hypothetical protein